MRRATTVVPLHYKTRLLKLSVMQGQTLSFLLKDIIEDYLKTNNRYKISKSGKREFFVNTNEVEDNGISTSEAIRITTIIPIKTRESLKKLCGKEGRTLSNMMRKIINKMIMNNGISYEK